MVPGLVLAMGTTVAWIIADAWLAIYVVGAGPKAFKTNRVVLGIAAIIGITGFWSPDPSASALAAVRVVCLYSMARSVRSPSIWWGPIIILTLQLFAGFWQLSVFDRPHGASANASQLGQTGLAFMYGPVAPVAALTLGISIARAPALGLFLLTLFRRTRYAWAMSALALAVFMSVTVWKAPERILPAGIATGFHQRQANSAGVPLDDEEVVAQLLADCGPPRLREWRWHGYGYHGYCLSTGQQRPHNFFVLTWWDLGLFAVPFWGLVAYGGWKTRRPEWLALFAVAMITDEIYGRPEGAYMIAAMWMLGQQAPVTLSNVRAGLSRAARRIGQ